MPRLMGVDIPGKKHVRYALRYIHGIGPKRADDVLAATGVDPMKKADDVTQNEIHAITTYIQDHYRVEGDLRREVCQTLARLLSLPRIAPPLCGVSSRQVLCHRFLPA